MNNNFIDIEPKSCGPLGTASKVDINVNLNIKASGCNIQVRLMNDLTFPVGTSNLTMSGLDYQNWGQDNTYVKDWVFTQLGLQDKI